jgi:predicted RNA-binding protein with RPS1 domain
MRLIVHKNPGNQEIMILDQEEFFFYRRLPLPQITGNVYYGTITGINKKLRAVFVKLSEDRVGLLNSYSIHPEYLAPDSEEIVKNLAKENPKSLKYSKYYNSIDFSRYLRIGQRIRVQVVNVCRDFKIKLSCFIVLKLNGIKYIPNSIKQVIHCSSQGLRKKLIGEKFCGSLYINKPFNGRIARSLDKLRCQWRQIEEKDLDNPEVGQKNNTPMLALQSHPLGNLLEHFKITEIATTNADEISELIERFGYVVVKTNKGIFSKYKAKIAQITDQTIQLSPGISCEVSRSSVGFQLMVKSTSITSYDPTNQIIEQIYLRNLGGLGIIAVSRKITLNLNTMLDKIKEKFANYNLHLYPILVRNFYLIVLSKKYHLPCAATYENHCRTAGEEEIILDDRSKINLSCGEDILKIDLNRHKSRETNFNINKTALIHIVKHKPKQKLLFIDLLESKAHELNLLTSYLQINFPARIRSYSLTSSVMIVEILE